MFRPGQNGQDNSKVTDEGLYGIDIEVETSTGSSIINLINNGFLCEQINTNDDSRRIIKVKQYNYGLVLSTDQELIGQTLGYDLFEQTTATSSSYSYKHKYKNAAGTTNTYYGLIQKYNKDDTYQNTILFEDSDKAENAIVYKIKHYLHGDIILPKWSFKGRGLRYYTDTSYLELPTIIYNRQVVQ